VEVYILIWKYGNGGNDIEMHDKGMFLGHNLL
jgi:hypothetical protein